MTASEVTSLLQRVSAHEAHLTRHEERDEVRFDAVDAKLDVLTEIVGGIKLVKWVLTLGVPAVVACLIAILFQHG